MDAVRFAEERGRMCSMYIGCKGCPLGELRNSVIISCSLWTLANMGEAVPIVEEWAAAHPRKTRQSEFLKQWPNCTKDATGVINLCPRYFDTGYICSGTEMDCAKCRSKFWGKVVE